MSTCVETPDTNSPGQLTDGWIPCAIIRDLERGGPEQVESETDLYIAYPISTMDNTAFNTTSFGHDGRARAGKAGVGGIGSSTATASTYTEGTLIIDAYASAEKKMVCAVAGP